MKYDNFITQWANIINESQVNEVSDIDVDWDDETLYDKNDKDRYERIANSIGTYDNFAREDMQSVIGIYEYFIDVLIQTNYKKIYPHIIKMLTYIENKKPLFTSERALKHVRSVIKEMGSLKNISDIKDTKDEEGVEESQNDTESPKYNEVFEKIRKFLEEKKYINVPDKTDECALFGHNPEITVSFIDSSIDQSKCEVSPEDIVKDVTDFIEKENLPVSYDISPEENSGEETEAIVIKVR